MTAPLEPVTLPLPSWSRGRLLRAAVAHRNAREAAFGHYDDARIDEVDAATLARWCVNYLRHEHTSYDADPSMAQMRRTHTAIAAQYDWLSAEANRQVVEREREDSLRESHRRDVAAADAHAGDAAGVHEALMTLCDDQGRTVAYADTDDETTGLLTRWRGMFGGHDIDVALLHYQGSPTWTLVIGFPELTESTIEHVNTELLRTRPANFYTLIAASYPLRHLCVNPQAHASTRTASSDSVPADAEIDLDDVYETMWERWEAHLSTTLGRWQASDALPGERAYDRMCGDRVCGVYTELSTQEAGASPARAQLWLRGLLSEAISVLTAHRDAFVTAQLA